MGGGGRGGRCPVKICLHGKMKLGRKRKRTVGRFKMLLYEPGKKSNEGRSFHQQKGETSVLKRTLWCVLM